MVALYVDPGWWGRGLGAALMEAARARMLELGFLKGSLWALAGNSRADRFYRINGWVPDGERKLDVVWGATVDEIRYRREL